MLAPDALSLLILAAATWRLAALFSYEEGPWQIFVRLRMLVGITPDPEDGRPSSWPHTVIAKAIVCVWCLSIWIGIGLTIVYALWPSVVWLLLPFALSTAAILIEQVARR